MTNIKQESVVCSVLFCIQNVQLQQEKHGLLAHVELEKLLPRNFTLKGQQ